MVTDPTTGIQGYRSGDIFDQARNELKQRAPAQYDYYNSMVIDPVTGEYGSRTRGGQAMDLLNQLGVDTTGINANLGGGDYSADSLGGVDISSMSGATIKKLRALANNPFMNLGPLSGLLGLLAGKAADYYAGDYGKDINPGVYDNDTFYRDSDGLISPVRGSDFYGSSEASSNAARASSAKAAADQALTNIYSDGTLNSGRNSLGVGGGNASRGFVTGGW